MSVLEKKKKGGVWGGRETERENGIDYPQGPEWNAVIPSYSYLFSSLCIFVYQDSIIKSLSTGCILSSLGYRIYIHGFIYHYSGVAKKTSQ